MKFKYKENNYNKNMFSLNLRMCILKKYLDVEIYRFCGVVLWYPEYFITCLLQNNMHTRQTMSLNQNGILIVSISML